MADFTKKFHRTAYPAISPTAAAQNQSGRTALITGGSDGIGLGIAGALAQAQISKVMLVSRTQAKLDKAAQQLQSEHPSTTFEAIASDAGDISAISDLWKQISDEGHFIDLLVLNAASFLAGVDPIEAATSFHFNVTANLHQLDHFQKQANTDKRPLTLLNVSSAAVQFYHFPSPAYAASKAGFANYLCHLAEFTPENEMRLINYHPGSVFTTAVKDTGLGFTGEENLWDDPSLSAHAAVWLCGKDAGFLHGRFVWAHWDVEKLMGMKDKILADAGYLKVGVADCGNVVMEDFMKKCNENPTPKVRVP